MAITKQNLYGALNRYLRAYAAMGVNLDIRFQEGSKTQGVAYSIEMKDGSTPPGTANGIIGLTRQEAWDTLLYIARGIEDLSHWQSKNVTGTTSYFRDKDGVVIGYEGLEE